MTENIYDRYGSGFIIKKDKGSGRKNRSRKAPRLELALNI